MELTILLVLLLATLISSPLGRGLGERGAALASTGLGALAAVLAWGVFVGTLGEGYEARTVFVAAWIESGTLASEIAFEVSRASAAIMVIALSLSTAAQFYAIALKTPKKLLKVGDSRAMRMTSSASLLALSLVVVALSAGTLLLSAGLIIFAVAAALALDFNVRSVGAGRAAARGLLIGLCGALLCLLAAGFLFAAADAVSFEVLAPLAESVPAAPMTLAFGLAGLALAASLPFLPWTRKASEVPGALAALLSICAGLVAVTVLLRAQPFLETAPLLLEGLLIATAVLAPLTAFAQQSGRASLAASALAPVALAAFCALNGDGTSALILLAGQGISLLLLGAALDRLTDRAGEEGTAAQTRGAQVAAIAGAASATGFGVPVLLGPLALMLPGYLGQAGVLGTAGALYWPMVATLALHSFAIWVLYLNAFHGHGKKKSDENWPEADSLTNRVANGILLAALLSLGIGVGTMIGTPAEGSLPGAPLVAGLAGLVLAVLSRLVPVTGAAALRPIFEGPLFLQDIYRLGLEAPLRALGRLIADRLDTSLLELIFEPLSARLLPGLSRRTAQLGASRAAPWAVGVIVAAALLLTLVTLAGG
ncbi:MAG: hypothetical protein AAF714_02430 [Pseudomonadota bacterium]